MNIYGTLVQTCKKNSEGFKYGLMDRTLEIYETKRGMKGVLFNSSRRGWKRKECVLSIAHFKRSDQDGKCSIEGVKEYFGF